MKFNIGNSMKLIKPQLSDKELKQIIRDCKLLQKPNFKQCRNILEKILNYVPKMLIDKKGFELLQFILNKYGLPIALCSQNFYKRINQSQELKEKFKEDIQRIQGLIISICKVQGQSEKVFEELSYYNTAGSTNKRYKVSQLNLKEFLYLRAFLAKLIDRVKGKIGGQLKSWEKEELNNIQTKVLKRKYGVLECHYLSQMIEKLRGFLNINQKQIQKNKGKSHGVHHVSSIKKMDIDTSQKLEQNEQLETTHSYLDAIKSVKKTNQQQGNYYSESHWKHLLYSPQHFIALKIAIYELQTRTLQSPIADHIFTTVHNNRLTEEQMLIIGVSKHAPIETFVSLLDQIEADLWKDRVEFIGITKNLRVEDDAQRQEARMTLARNGEKFREANDVFVFDDMERATPFRLLWREMHIKVQALPDLFRGN